MKRTLMLLMLLASLQLFAQNKPAPPVGVELLLGHERSSFKVSMNKPIAGPFRYMNITIATGYYDSDKSKTELVMINSAIYQFHANVGVSAGLDYHFLKGIVPSVGVHFTHGDPVWRVMFIPFINFRPDVNSENVLLLEYKPRINDTFKLYTSALALYNQNLSLGEHDRSFLQVRLGLTHRNFTFGAGTNIDYYGSQKSNENTYCAFLMVDI